jgi:hypothetical protein
VNKYCAYLNIPVSLFKEHIDPFQLPKITHFKLDKDEVINNELTNWFTSVKLEILLVEAFYRPPNNIGGIHTDSVGGDYTKLNWQFGGKDSVMNWYSETTPNVQKRSITPIGTNSISYDDTTLTKIHSQPIQNPSLVQVGVPHNIENFLEERWVVSVVYKHSNIKHIDFRPTWNQSLVLFNEYLIK